MNMKFSDNQARMLKVAAEDEIAQKELALRRMVKLVKDGGEKKTKLEEDVAAIFEADKNRKMFSLAQKRMQGLEDEVRALAGDPANQVAIEKKLKEIKTFKEVVDRLEKGARPPKLNFPVMNLERVQFELARLNEKLAEVQVRLDLAAAEYEQLTGRPFEGLADLAHAEPEAESTSEPEPLSALERAMKKPPSTSAPVEFGAPAAPPSGPPSPPPTTPPAAAAQTKEDEDDIFEVEALDVNRLMSRVAAIAARQIAGGTNYKSSKEDDAKDEAASPLPDDLVPVAMRLINYILGITDDTNFIGPDQVYKGKAGEEGNEEIKKELEQKSLIFNTYVDQIIARHGALAKLKEERPNYLEAKREVEFAQDQIKSLRKDLMKLKSNEAADPAVVAQKENAIKSLEEDTAALEDTIKTERDLRKNLRHDRQVLANHLARTVNQILRSPREQVSGVKKVWDKARQRFVMQKVKSEPGLSVFNVAPAAGAAPTRGTRISKMDERDRAQMEELIEAEERREREDAKSNRPMWQQVPPPSYTGYGQDAARWSTSPGRVSALPPPEKEQKGRPSYSRQQQIKPGRPSIEYGRQRESGKPDIFVQKAPVRPKKSYFMVDQIPLSKTSAKTPFDPSDPRQMSEQDIRALEREEAEEESAAKALLRSLKPESRALMQKVLAKVKDKVPLNSAEQKFFRFMQGQLSKVKEQLGYESGGEQAIGAPTEEEQKKNEPVFVEIHEQESEGRAGSRARLRKFHEDTLLSEIHEGAHGGPVAVPEIVARKVAKTKEAKAMYGRWIEEAKKLPKVGAQRPNGTKVTREDRAAAKEAMEQRWAAEYAQFRGPKEFRDKERSTMAEHGWLPAELPHGAAEMLKSFKQHIQDLDATPKGEIEYISQRQTGLPNPKTGPLKSRPFFTERPPAAAPEKKVPEMNSPKERLLIDQTSQPFSTPQQVEKIPNQPWKEREQTPDLNKVRQKPEKDKVEKAFEEMRKNLKR